MGRGVLAVAASGGRDSTALLHATARQARDANLSVVALHVHHGLMPDADLWWRQLSQQCARWRRSGLPVRFIGTRLTDRPKPGESVEAWARRERYRALAAMALAAGAGVILLAHHRRDQAETFVLQALRGAGPRGLSAMPAMAERGGLSWCRPWLNVSVDAIDAYVRRYGLKVVNDESNVDSRFARSRLRTQVWPTLLKAFPDAENSLAAAARQAQEAQAVLLEVATHDLTQCADGSGRLVLQRWAALSHPRRTWLLRHWLRQSAGRGMPESLVQRLCLEWPAAGSGRRWSAEGGWVFSGPGYLDWEATATPRVSAPIGRESVIDLSNPGVVQTPGWGGHWRVALAESEGVPADWLRDAELRPRAGSEQFQRHARGVPRSLKKQFQSVGIAAFERRGPLLYARGRLVYVPGLGLDARVVGCGERPYLTVEWVPDYGSVNSLVIAP